MLNWGRPILKGLEDKEPEETIKECRVGGENSTEVFNRRKCCSKTEEKENK